MISASVSIYGYPSSFDKALAIEVLPEAIKPHSMMFVFSLFIAYKVLVFYNNQLSYKIRINTIIKKSNNSLFVKPIIQLLTRYMQEI